MRIEFESHICKMKVKEMCQRYCRKHISKRSCLLAYTSLFVVFNNSKNVSLRNPVSLFESPMLENMPFSESSIFGKDGDVADSVCVALSSLPMSIFMCEVQQT